ncbi:MAG: cobalamin-binding protein [Wenzhouxiangellaceae bacterium]
MPYGPRRIICLTAETVDTLYRIDADDRIVGITGFATNPPQARREKPRIAAYTNAKMDRIVDLKPDLVLAYSDLQADLVAELIRAGIEVYTFNQRSIAGILEMIYRLGQLVDASDQAQGLIRQLEASLHPPATSSQRRPRVYFEEWPEPMICGIQWVSELIELSGGIDCFAERARGQAASQRIISDPREVINAQPEIIIGSWCGRRFRAETIQQRRGWQTIPAVANHQVYEIKSAYILQPGPTALIQGRLALSQIFRDWSQPENAEIKHNR